MAVTEKEVSQQEYNYEYSSIAFFFFLLALVQLISPLHSVLNLQLLLPLSFLFRNLLAELGDDLAAVKWTRCTRLTFSFRP